MDLTSILSLFPHVLDSVVAIEKAAKGLPGSSKKAIVLDSIQAAAKVGSTIPIPQVALISKLIDTVVRELNVAGVFTKGVPANAS